QPGRGHHGAGRRDRRAERREARERGRVDDARDALQIGAELLGTGEVRLRAGAVAACSDDEYGGGRETPPGMARTWGHAVPPDCERAGGSRVRERREVQPETYRCDPARTVTGR